LRQSFAAKENISLIFQIFTFADRIQALVKVLKTISDPTRFFRSSLTKNRFQK